jgi:hypothetical protein
MPSLDKNFLMLLKDDYRKYPVFIETGTYIGETIFNMEEYFKELYTIEIKEEFLVNVKNRYGGNKINFLLGDSSKVLTTLLPNIQEKVIFFLDGHWSWGDTGKGDKHCPLYEELYSIKNLYKNSAIIIIDDVRLFGTNNICDWSDINKSKIVSILDDRIEQMYFLDSSLSKNDRMIIHLI